LRRLARGTGPESAAVAELERGGTDVGAQDIEVPAGVKRTFAPAI
jgi:hypothetical protein